MPRADQAAVDEPRNFPLVTPAGARRLGCRRQTVQDRGYIRKRHSLAKHVKDASDRVAARACRDVGQQRLDFDRSKRFAIKPADDFGAQPHGIPVSPKVDECCPYGGVAFWANAQQRDQCIEAFCIRRRRTQQDMSKVIFQLGPRFAQRRRFHHDGAHAEAGGI